jgi:septal ring factor EnvC (AmiA/AmiB activator)
MAMADDQKISPGMERHAISILTVVIVALIMWVGNSVQQTQVTLGQIEVELSYIKNSLSNDRNKFQKIEERLDSIERELRSLQAQRDTKEF